MLVEYGGGMAEQVVTVMGPDMSKSGGRKDLAELRWSIVSGSRWTMLFGVPLMFGLMMFGREFFANWMGPDKIDCGWLTLIVAAGAIWPLAGRSCGATLWSLGHVRQWAFLRVIEAVLNLGTAVVLIAVFNLGVFGMAIGAAFSMFVISGVLLPTYACRITELKIGKYLQATVLRWLAAAGLFVLISQGLILLIPPAGWMEFWIKAVAAAGLYIVPGFMIILGPTRFREFARGILRWRSRQKLGRQEAGGEPPS
jgi:O-antigen/teichoic acid export membrane protein